MELWTHADCTSALQHLKKQSKYKKVLTTEAEDITAVPEREMASYHKSLHTAAGPPGHQPVAGGTPSVLSGIYGASSEEHLKVVGDYLRSHQHQIVPIKQDGSCLAHACRRATNAPREYCTQMLRRQVVKFVCANADFFFQALAPLLQHEHGFLRLGEEALAKRVKEGAAEEWIDLQKNYPGPFSFASWLEHILHEDTWLDTAFLYVVSCMWDVSVTILSEVYLSEVRIRHNFSWWDSNIVVVHHSGNHFNLAGKYYFVLYLLSELFVRPAQRFEFRRRGSVAGRKGLIKRAQRFISVFSVFDNFSCFQFFFCCGPFLISSCILFLFSVHIEDDTHFLLDHLPLIQSPNFKLSEENPVLFTDQDVDHHFSERELDEPLPILLEEGEEAGAEAAGGPSTSTYQKKPLKKGEVQRLLDSHHHLVVILRGLGVDPCADFHEDRVQRELERVVAGTTTCTLCHRTLRDTPALRNHIKSVHQKIAEFSCSQCHYCFSNKSSLTRHMKSDHSDEPIHRCKYMVDELNEDTQQMEKVPCPFQSRIATKVKEHEASHEDPIPCDFQPRGCTKAFSLRRNMRSHMKICPFNPSPPAAIRHHCPYCEVTCGRKADVNRHIGEQHPGQALLPK